MRAPTPSAAAEIAVPDVRELIYRIDSYNERLASLLIRAVERKRELLLMLAEREVIKNPASVIQNKRDEVNGTLEEATKKIKEILKDKRTQLTLLCEKLNALSPLSVLKRGYALVECGSAAVKSVSDVSVGDKLSVKLSDGTLSVSVDSLTKKKGGR
jgi:exodeoxyribonuclease VII large subunit